jgi:DHA1 family tetracycline resistance protein-like MFS transporter
MPESKRRALLLIFGYVFIDLLGYSLILPLLPYYALNFGSTLSLVGFLGTANALAQLVASPVIGRLSDRHGRRPLLIFCTAGTVLSFLLLGLAGSLTMIFLSRVMDGLLGGNNALARAYITDVTDEKNRARGLGLIGAAFGLGFIIGPAMGGFLSRYGYQVPALVAAAFSLVNLVAVILWLPESLTEKVKEEIRSGPQTALTLRALWEALNRPCCAALLQMQLWYGLAFTLFQSSFSLYAKARFALTAQGTSYVLTYVGVLAVLVQGVAIGRLTARFRERALVLAGVVVMTLSLLAWGFAPSVAALLAVLAPIALAGGVLNTLLSSQLTKAVRAEEVGGILGLSAGLQSFAQIVAPAVGSVALDRVGTWAPGLLGALLMTWPVVLAWRHPGSGQNNVPECAPSASSA